MKQLILPLLLFITIVGCNVPKQVIVGMSEPEFKHDHPKAKVVEMSNIRTVYREWVYTISDTTPRFYYFSNGKLMLMDEGFVLPHNTQAVPTPL